MDLESVSSRHRRNLLPGLAKARALAAAGASVTVTGRDPAKVEEAQGALGPQAGTAIVDSTGSPLYHLVLCVSEGQGRVGVRRWISSSSDGVRGHQRRAGGDGALLAVELRPTRVNAVSPGV